MSPVSPELALVLSLALVPAVAALGLARRRLLRRPDDAGLGVSGALEAERRVVEWLEPLEREGWRVFHDLHLPRADGRGTIHLDHVVLGPGGIFVIETRPANGPVSGCRYDRWWTRSEGGREERFANPLLEVSRRARAVALWLRVPDAWVKGVVFLVGRPERGKETPDKVVTGDHAGWIRACGRDGKALAPAEVFRIGEELDGLRRRKLSLLHALRLGGAEEAMGAGDYLSLGVVRSVEGEGLRLRA